MRTYHKVGLWSAVIAGVVVASSVIAVLVTKKVGAPEHSMQRDCVMVGSKCFDLEVVDTELRRQQGLSGREALDKHSGMLFVFDEPSPSHCFWMKDMRFAIDMIWLNDQQKVVTIESRVSPDSYPNSFCPSAEAQYVIELDSGESEAAGLEIGDTVSL